jgi:hypothetical protein
MGQDKNASMTDQIEVWHIDWANKMCYPMLWAVDQTLGCVTEHRAHGFETLSLTQLWSHMTWFLPLVVL